MSTPASCAALASTGSLPAAKSAGVGRISSSGVTPVCSRLSVRHHKVGVGDRRAVEDLPVRALLEGVVTGFHDPSRSENCSPMLELDHTRHQLRRGSRPAVDKNNRFALKGSRITALGECRLQVGVRPVRLLIVTS